MMTNPNVFSALAYIKTVDDPLMVFSNYICYSMQRLGGKRLVPEQIINAVGEDFGIRLSTYVFEACRKLLIKSNRIVNDNKAFTLVNVGFDIEKFKSDKLHMQQNEEGLINNLIDYVKTYGISWSSEESRQYLGSFLLQDGHAFNLFTDHKINIVFDDTKVSPEWYIGKYIEKVLAEKESYGEYLSQIVNGLMVYIGVYETSSSHQQAGQKYRGTYFFLDTKLILRALGYSTQYEIQAVNEMISLIRDDYQGVIAVFEHTVREVETALSNAAYSIQNGAAIKDIEMQAFRTIKTFDSLDFSIASSNVRNMLEKMSVTIVNDSIQWNNPIVRQNNIDDDTLRQYIMSRFSWNEKVVQNDINSINTINIMRRSDYSIAFGGKKQLPIFVTSNTALIACVRNYVEEHKDPGELTGWNKHRLPIISDYLLTCRLWLPKANVHKELPILTLARDAQAAQQSNSVFYTKLAQEMKELQEKHSLNIIDLDEERRAKLEEITIATVKGAVDQIDADSIAYSFKELLVLETASDKKRIEELEEKNHKMEEISKRKDIQYINAIAKRFSTNWRAIRFFSFIAKYMYWIVLLGVVLIPQLIVAIINVPNTWKWITIGISLLIIIIDKCIDRFTWADVLSTLLIKYAIERGCSQITADLSDEESDHLTEIVNVVFETIPCLEWFHKVYPKRHTEIIDQYFKSHNNNY